MQLLLHRSNFLGGGRIAETNQENSGLLLAGDFFFAFWFLVTFYICIRIFNFPPQISVLSAYMF